MKAPKILVEETMGGGNANRNRGEVISGTVLTGGQVLV